MKLSASSVSRVNSCPASWQLENQIAEGERYNAFEGAASFGRSCHAAAESLLKALIEGARLTTKQALKKEGLLFDDRAKDIVEYYVKYVKGVWKKTKPKTLIVEDKFRTDIAGVDCVFKCDAMSIANNHIDIFDLKTGNFDYVHSAGYQLTFSVALYAVIHKLKNVSFTCHIVQPGYFNEAYQVRTIEGTYNSWMDAHNYLIDMTEDLLLRASEYNVGSQCAFCPGILRCPAVTAIVKFVAGRALLDTSIEAINPKLLCDMFSAKKAIDAYMSAVEQYLTNQLQSGKQFSNVWLKPSFGHRYYPDTESVIKEFGYLGEELYDQKLKTPAQLEKIVGKSNLERFVDKQQRFTLSIREAADNPFSEEK